MAKRIKLIIGSTRQNRISPEIAAWVEAHAKHENMELETIDLKELDLPAFDAPIPPSYAPTETEKGKEWAEIVTNSDGFIFVTAEYNRSIPASLKNALDYLAAEWNDKPAAIVSYGYIDGGLTATRHLSDILGMLKVEVVEPTVALQLSPELFAEDGSFKDADAAFTASVETLNDAVQKLV